jgi:hypothetical protein
VLRAQELAQQPVVQGSRRRSFRRTTDERLERKPSTCCSISTSIRLIVSSSRWSTDVVRVGGQVRAAEIVLGDDIANELVDWFNAVDLTYRSDLRELNELNFARFEAKLEQQLAELRAELLTDLRTEIAGLRTELVRWMFPFWVSTMLGIAGLLIALRGP